MIYEIATIQVKPGVHAEFEAAIAAAVPLFKRSRGCQSLRLERSIEQPDSYKLVIGWATLEDHTVHFRESEELQEFRRLAGGFVAGPSHMEHVQVVLTGF
ncbi:antibiotic biosynthesis monooxygenase [Pseudoduganella ginsengisoli]|uniref:Antibiotic biosynthesis monooxygenase n=1 Tax=Pseudoduganella ginsengisoli TaxID=1462440 RepID=A0A6L6Q700_9BURK|nr:antibiotic biosynthesis monooxygenase [Pseudoduganella ginsengisoli]MTW05219.1 antibiotic biosynthesis monooxygenase [Pseudoduganella ginsengisoli]